MIKVTDKDGSVIAGLFRNSNNSSIVVNDPDAYQKYLLQRAAKDRDANVISSLQSEVAELKALIEKMLNR